MLLSRQQRQLWAEHSPCIPTPANEALALPTTESVTIALRTQQIVAYESGLADVVDPLGGSYYVEAMTNAIEAEAKEYIRKIDEMGGAVEAIDKGYIQKEIQDSAYAWQMAVESGERTIVGSQQVHYGRSSG